VKILSLKRRRGIPLQIYAGLANYFFQIRSPGRIPSNSIGILFYFLLCTTFCYADPPDAGRNKGAEPAENGSA